MLAVDLPWSPGAARPGIAVSNAPDELLDAIVWLLRLLDRPRDRKAMTPLFKREVLWRLMTGEQGDVVRQLGLADSSLNHITRAVQWIRENYTRPFRVDEVAQLSGMSVSAFHRNFGRTESSISDAHYEIKRSGHRIRVNGDDQGLQSLDRLRRSSALHPDATAREFLLHGRERSKSTCVDERHAGQVEFDTCGFHGDHGSAKIAELWLNGHVEVAGQFQMHATALESP